MNGSQYIKSVNFRGFSLVFGPLSPFMRGSDPLGGGSVIRRAHLVHGGDIMSFFGHFGDRPPHTTGRGSVGQQNLTIWSKTTIMRFFHHFDSSIPLSSILEAFPCLFGHRNSLLDLSMVMEGKLGVFHGFLCESRAGDYFFVTFGYSDHPCGYTNRLWVPFGALLPIRTPPYLGVMILAPHEADFHGHVPPPGKFQGFSAHTPSSAWGGVFPAML